MEKEEERDKRQTESKVVLMFKEKRSLGAWCGKPLRFCWKTLSFAIKTSLMAGFYLKKIIVDIIVEKGAKEKEKKNQLKMLM